jgi:polyphenol oxidase
VLSGWVGDAPAGRVRWAFSDRHGGTSAGPYASLNLGGNVGDSRAAVQVNRERLAVRLGLAPDQLRFMDQVHGDRVAVVDAADGAVGGPATPAGTDALVTAAPGVALVVLVADCVPVLLADPVTGVVAAVHAGRPGVASHLVLRALDSMVERGARAERTVAWLGPSVCPACYEVPEPMRAEVTGSVPASWATSRDGTPALDLRKGLLAELTARGVGAETVGPCTAESADHFSYRRDGTTGRCAGVVWVSPPRAGEAP